MNKKVLTNCWIIFTIAFLILIVASMSAVIYGAKDIQVKDVIESFVHYDSSDTSHQIIRELRFPRVGGAMLIGAAFGVAGAIMQGITRNPLADTGILGINAGATFVVSLCFAFYPALSYGWLTVLSFGGAAAATVIIYLFARHPTRGITPMRLILAGMIVTALLSSLSSGIAIYFDLSQDIAFWFAGGIAGVGWEELRWLIPILLPAILLSFLLSKSITLISVGEEVAINLGGSVRRTQFLATIIAIILAGVSASAVGAVSFVGLVVPHISRRFVGTDYRYVLPLSALLGAVFLVMADLASRTIQPPREVAIGAMAALVGVPFFLYLARRETKNL